MTWNDIEKVPPPRGRCIVTNNIDARDASGAMSHIWLLTPRRSARDETYGQWVGFDDADRDVLGITHWYPLPPLPGAGNGV